jgi:hypothetical protein
VTAGIQGVVVEDVVLEDALHSFLLPTFVHTNFVVLPLTFVVATDPIFVQAPPEVAANVFDIEKEENNSAAIVILRIFAILKEYLEIPRDNLHAYCLGFPWILINCLGLYSLLLRYGHGWNGLWLMGEWEEGLGVARDRGIIDDELRGRLLSLEFDREHKQQGFPMRVALMLLGSIVLLIPLFAVTVRVLGPDPSQLLIALVLLVLGAIAEGIALLVRRAKPLAFLAGIIGSFAGIPLGIAVVVLLPNDASGATGAVGSCIAAVWSLLWFRRTKGGIPVAVMIGEIAVTIGLVSDSVDLGTQNTGVLLCVFGVVGALGAIFGRIKPSLPPLIASLIVVGVGSAMQNSYGGKVVAVMGISISAVLFLLAYKRSEALMASAAAISTGVWGVVLAATLTTGAFAPIIVAAVIGIALITWGLRLSRLQK